MAAPTSPQFDSNQSEMWWRLSPKRQNQLSSIFIVTLVMLSCALIYRYFTSTPVMEPQSVVANDQPTAAPTPATQNQPSNISRYTVQPNDSLWIIALKFYGDGLAWTQIAESNHLQADAHGNYDLESGQTLEIPLSASTTRASQLQPSNASPNITITKTTYVIQPGDNLWSIAEQHYGDGQQWHIIFALASNRLGLSADGQPLIHAGNTITLPAINLDP